MSGVKERVPSAMEAVRTLRTKLASRKQDAVLSMASPGMPIETLESIRGALEPLGLFSDDALLFMSGGGNRIIMDASGTIVGSSLFDNVDAPLALFDQGTFALEYAKRGQALKASTDDMAQLFGPRVPCGVRPWGRTPAFLVEGRGFVVTGRYEEELVAAAILIEKACRAEMLAPKVGQIHYLNPALCMAEHAVYLASYSKREKEAHDG